MASTILVILQLSLIASFIASFVIWIVVLRNRVFRKQDRSQANVFQETTPTAAIDRTVESLLPSHAREIPFWGVAEILMMFGIMILAGSLLMTAGISNGWIERPVEKTVEPGSVIDSAIAAEDAAMESVIATEPESKTANPLPSIAVSSLASLIALCAVISWMHLIDRRACRKISFTTTWDDLRLGLIASLMILPPVLLISAAANHFIPYHHPVIDALGNLNSPGAISLLFISTAVITPICEEMLFRVLLQGGMQGIADRDVGQVRNDVDHCEAATYRAKAYWPLLVASFIFAGLHSGQGAAPIPLFFLSLGLGFLYRQTGRIAAPVIVHMVLNSLTLIQVMLEK